MDTGTVVVGIGVIISLFGYLELIRRDLRSEINDVREASADAHKEINDKLNAIQITQATHSEKFNKVDEQFNKVDEQFKRVDERFNKVDERFNTVDEKFNTVQTQIKSVDDKVDKLGNS